MRILSVGRPLAHPTIDNHTIFNAPAFSDYEAVVLDPGGILETVREAVDGTAEFRTYGDEPVVNGATTPTSMSVGEVLRRRRAEVMRCLERGGVVVVFLYPQATLPDVIGFTGADRYWLLPAPAGLAWAPPAIQWGEGAVVATTDHGHAFARFFDAAGSDLLYRAVFDETAPGFAGAGRVFARSGGGHPAAAEFAVLGGTVVFLPTPRRRSGEQAYALGAAIEEAVRDRLGRADAAEGAPFWLEQESVPGLAELALKAEVARERAQLAEEQAQAAEREAGELGRVREVLWREGRHSLVPAAIRCFELLGFRVWPGDDVVLRCDEGDLLLEVEGASGTVGMAPHYRLRGRLDAALAEGRVERGLVLVNGERTTAPQYRTAPYLDALRVASEASRYALLTAPELFRAAMLAYEVAEGDVLSSLRRRLLETDGVVTLGGE
ncbi:MAG: hypothetical protein AB7I38_13795 [Dehalococcoidia bacterium]